MARRIPAVETMYGNGNASPPSTLAAQIVRNQQAPAQQNGARATFAQLIHEILHNQSSVQETNIEVNVQLISVVAEAGLGQLTQGSLFVTWDEQIQQAIDSVKIIETTIERQPDVLLAPVSEDGPQLALILLVRTLAICGRPRCQDVPIARLIKSSFRSLDASPDSWTAANVLRQVCQDCVDDALTALENAPNNTTVFTLNLPPARSVAVLFPQSATKIALPQGCQANISDRVHAFLIVLELYPTVASGAIWQMEVQRRLQAILPRIRSLLEATKQWQRTVEQLLLSEYNLPLLETLLYEAINVKPAFELQVLLSKALVVALRNNNNTFSSLLVSTLQSLALADRFTDLHDDLKFTVTLWLDRLVPESRHPPQISSLKEVLCQGDAMTDSDLQTAFQQQYTCQAPTSLRRQIRKRRKENPEKPEVQRTTVLSETLRLLTETETEDLASLRSTAPIVYPVLSKDKQYRAWGLLTKLSLTEPELTLQTVLNLIDLADVRQDKRIRVLSMLTVTSCLQQTTDPAFLDLAKSHPGQLCLGALHSSLRELRVAAGRCLPCFLRDDLSYSLKTENRRVALEYLRALSNRDVASEHETLIGAWGQVALACGDRELNLVVLRMVEYLGHSNSLVCALAYEELEKLAAARKQAPEDLFRPFLATVAVSVVQDLLSRPQKAQQLCDLIKMDINHFLLLTQQATIPALVLTKKKAVLQRVANSRGNNSSIQDLCVQPLTNLAAILAILLIQSVPDPEGSAFECLTAVAPELRGTTVESLVKLDVALVACEMLKHCGDANPDRKSRAYKSFHTFVNIAERRSGKEKSRSKAHKSLAEFFDFHILGIMTHFSLALETTETTHEKIRCLNAISDMTALIKGQARIALPQLRACLQSAMEQPELSEAAFSAWLALISVLESEQIAQVVDQTFALILRYWALFSPQLQKMTQEMIGALLKSHNHVLQENIMTVPALKEIPLLSKYGSEIARLQSQADVESYCKAFAIRLKSESSTVMLQALKELVLFLAEHQETMNDLIVSEQPPANLCELLRALLDVTAMYSTTSPEAADLCGQALGVIGCLDPNRVEATRKKRQVLVLSNFDVANEVIDWTLALFEDVLVKAFKSVTNARAQGFLAFVMQELLRFCNFNDNTVLRSRSSQVPSAEERWNAMPEHIRLTLTPFLTSKYVVTSNAPNKPPNRPYPSFSPDSTHTSWLRSLVYDLMWKAKGDNAQMVFPLIARVIRGHDLAIPIFMLPYAVLNVVLGGTVTETQGITAEMLAVLESHPTSNGQLDTIRQCSESVFAALDYISTWLQEKKKSVGDSRSNAYKTGHSASDFNEIKDMGQIETVERFLAGIPAEAIAARAIECGSYARALFHWEKYIRQHRAIVPSSQFSPREEEMYTRLQNIYAQIDEPDGLEGIGAHLSFLTDEQKVTQNTKAGRWTAAQVWYEKQFTERPFDTGVQTSLLACLRETGQFTTLLRYADSIMALSSKAVEVSAHTSLVLPLALEATWVAGDLGLLRTWLKLAQPHNSQDFAVRLGQLLATEIKNNSQSFTDQLSALRKSITEGMTATGTSSLQACHDDLKKLHVLYEIEAIRNCDKSKSDRLLLTFDKRQAILGSYLGDMQFILGVRRAAMCSNGDTFTPLQQATSWLATARLARKAKNTHSAYNAVLQAYKHGDKSAKLEEARLLWHDGHQRQAIQALESFKSSGVLAQFNVQVPETSESAESGSKEQNMLSAKAHLLLAKWLDASGQSQAKDMTARYQYAAGNFRRWEKGHYYLGKHYNKLLEAERALPKSKQASVYLGGEMTRLTIENLLRSIPFGNKYWHQSIPKILTLWLDMGMETLKPAVREDQAVFERRGRALQSVHKQLGKYFDRVPPYVFYTALPQIISRITHPHPEVWKQIAYILTKIVATHPNQALWSLLAVVKASEGLRVQRGNEILNRTRDGKAKVKSDISSADLRAMINQGQKLSECLLQACEAHVEHRTLHVSLAKDLGFNHKLAPCALVVPVEATLSVNLPTDADHAKIRFHKAFSQEKITIQSFMDDVLVLSSLQRPRKITVRGSDGKSYGLLCKPKDDLRKDQRLMEFNGIINRALKRDAESSKRRLYIKTYAVTPLSEESGTIEWVEGIKPIRDILLGIYARKGVRPNYNDLRNLLNEACSAPENAKFFTERVLSKFPPSLHEWFAEVYPEPDSWFAARLRYARSAAVTSMTGHVLGLGDRHGENILLEEGTGGVFHVDFNCLFDKGLTFEKPEVVPFRLTHNMVDAMGPYGYDGPFRMSCELTMRLLRQSKDTLMTVLETFLYDPTTDFVGKKKRAIAGVPETPQEILDSVDGKLKGLLRGETVPLSVEGYVDALIREAVSPLNLASMYIGWCPFF